MSEPLSGNAHQSKDQAAVNSPAKSTFADWTGEREVITLGSNHGASELPFQMWRRFKEAFAPELVDRAITQSPITVRRCLDPFGGSGTTALACQFLGVHPFTVEVNPFLVDLIEAKLASYDADKLTDDLSTLLSTMDPTNVDLEATFGAGPATMVEPGIKGRWIFDVDIARRIAALLESIRKLSSKSSRRLFRVLLGGILIDVSNVIVSGKGRRYRRGIQMGGRSGDEVSTAFRNLASRAICEIHRFRRRPVLTYDVILGDSRECLKDAKDYEIAVFSPPYPNSFDYTDVYNVELWTLGYLRDRQDNRDLRTSTMCSHVQLKRDYPPPPVGSPILNEVVERLESQRENLWSASLPDMIGGYFADLFEVLDTTWGALVQGATAWLVVGDSRYSDVHVPTAEVIAELAPNRGWIIETVEPLRDMRVSAQQGGDHRLAETLVVLVKS